MSSFHQDYQSDTFSLWNFLAFTFLKRFKCYWPALNAVLLLLEDSSYYLNFSQASVEKVLVWKFYYISPCKFLLPWSCSLHFHWGSENLKGRSEKKYIPNLIAQKWFLSFTYLYSVTWLNSSKFGPHAVIYSCTEVSHASTSICVYQSRHAQMTDKAVFV